MDAAAFLLITLLGFAVVYIVYLRIQLYINARIVKAFQAASVVVPQAAVPKGGINKIALAIFGFLAFASIALLSNGV